MFSAGDPHCCIYFDILSDMFSWHSTRPSFRYLYNIHILSYSGILFFQVSGIQHLAFYLTSILSFYLANYMKFYLAFCLAFSTSLRPKDLANSRFGSHVPESWQARHSVQAIRSWQTPDNYLALKRLASSQ